MRLIWVTTTNYCLETLKLLRMHESYIKMIQTTEEGGKGRTDSLDNESNAPYPPKIGHYHDDNVNHDHETVSINKDAISLSIQTKNWSLNHHTKPFVHRYDSNPCETSTASHNITTLQMASYLPKEPSITYHATSK